MLRSLALLFGLVSGLDAGTIRLSLVPTSTVYADGVSPDDTSRIDVTLHDPPMLTSPTIWGAWYNGTSAPGETIRYRHDNYFQDALTLTLITPVTIGGDPHNQTLTIYVDPKHSFFGWTWTYLYPWWLSLPTYLYNAQADRWESQLDLAQSFVSLQSTHYPAMFEFVWWDLNNNPKGVWLGRASVHSVTPIPEPTTVSLLAGSIALLASIKGRSFVKQVIGTLRSMNC